MRKGINYLLFFVCSLLFTACASTYKTIRPTSISYTNHNIDDGISFSYKYDVLQSSGNKKYAKHEEMNNIKLVSVKITNNTQDKLSLQNDVQFYSGNRNVYPLSPEVLKSELSQGVPIYLLYLLLLPTNIYKTETNSSTGMTDTNTIPIGLVLGPGISIGNMVYASSANNNFYNELLQNSLTKELAVGETVYGLVGFRDVGYEQITLKLRK